MRVSGKLLASIGFAVVVAVCTSSHALAQDEDPDIPKARIPRLPGAGHRAQDFAPTGWAVQVQASGDLNADGRADLVFVLHGIDRRLVVHSQGFGVEDLDTNPRVIGVAFAQPDGTYRLAAQNSTLIPRWTERNMDDYFGDEGSLTVARGAFSVGLHYFANMGGWDAGSTTLTFRWQHGRFELIGYENDNLKRNSGEETTTSVNYSTHVRMVSTATDDKSARMRRMQLAPRPLLTLDAVGDGLAFAEPWGELPK